MLDSQVRRSSIWFFLWARQKKPAQPLALTFRIAPEKTARERGNGSRRPPPEGLSVVGPAAKLERTAQRIRFRVARRERHQVPALLDECQN